MSGEPPESTGLIRVNAGSGLPAYRIYLPECRPGDDAFRRLLVLVHGISRNVDELLAAFRPLADRFGLVLLAPLFDEANYAGYQRLGQDARGPGSGRHDLVLRRVLEAARARAPLPTGPVLMFGHSGGAQFTHRFAMAHPDDVACYALSAAGWYTMPDLAHAFPKGMKPATGADQPILDLEAFLRIPASVFVGTADTERDDALRQSGFLDSTEGATRFDRAERWVEAVTMAARWRGLDTPFHFHPVPGVGHDFTDVAVRGRVPELAVKWLLNAKESA